MPLKEQIQTHREREELKSDIEEVIRQAEQEGKTAEQLVLMIKKALAVFLFNHEK